MSSNGQARFDLLLREGRINSMVTRNRIITGPMERNLANRDGSLTTAYVDYLAERAHGGASLIVIESTYVDTARHGSHLPGRVPRRPRDPRARRAAEAVHARGSKARNRAVHRRPPDPFDHVAATADRAVRRPLQGASIPFRTPVR